MAAQAAAVAAADADSSSFFGWWLVVGGWWFVVCSYGSEPRTLTTNHELLNLIWNDRLSIAFQRTAKATDSRGRFDDESL